MQLAAAVGRPDPHVGELPVAYVQLKPGAAATEDELMSFAKAQISERAAIPKAIRLVGSLPLTSVGKIFKPALREREIGDALDAALAAAGALADGIKVTNDPHVGVKVDVMLVRGATAGRAREILGQFPFRFELSWTS